MTENARRSNPVIIDHVGLTKGGITFRSPPLVGEVPSQPNQSTFGPIEFSEKPLGAKVAKVFSRQFCNFLSIKTADINRLMEYSKHPFATSQKSKRVAKALLRIIRKSGLFQTKTVIFYDFITFSRSRAGFFRNLILLLLRKKEKPTGKRSAS